MPWTLGDVHVESLRASEDVHIEGENVSHELDALGASILSLIATKADTHNPTFTGTVTLPDSTIVDWTTDQGDVNIDANNIPILSYAPNTLASNGTAGLSNFNFTQARKDKLAAIETGAQANVQANWIASGTAAAILNKPSWIPYSNPGYLTAVPASVADAIALNTAKVSYPGPPTYAEVTNKPNLQQALTISNTLSSTFGGVNYLLGGLNLTSGTLTYIPPELGNLAPTHAPSFTGGVTLPSTTSIGNVSATEITYLDGVTSAIQTQLDGKQAAGNYLTVAAGDARYIQSIPSEYITESEGDARYVELTDTGANKITYLNTVSSDVQTQLDGKTSLTQTSTTASLPFASTASGVLGSLKYSTADDDSKAEFFFGTNNNSPTFTVDSAQGISTPMVVQCSTLIVTNGVNIHNNLVTVEAVNNRVGINKAIPTKTLDVNGDATISGRLQRQNNGNSAIPFHSGDYGRVWISYTGANTAAYSNGAEIFFDPVYGNAHFNGWVTAAHFQQTSDDRLKFNEKDVTDGLSVVRRLQPQTYDKSNELNSEINTKKEVGLIAQDVLLIPELAHTVHQGPEDERPDDRYHVDYNGAFVYGLSAIKELDAIVAAQAALISELDDKVTSLLERLAGL